MSRLPFPIDHPSLFPASCAVALLAAAISRLRRPALAPPTAAFADPALDRSDDAAVTRLERRRDEIAATVTNTGRPRRLTLSPGSTATRPAEFPIDTGPMTVTRPVGNAEAPVAVARLNPADRWPE